MKLERHSKIVELIGKYEIDTQEELAARLNEAGFNVTQATVSRDIKELRLLKVLAEGGRYKYATVERAEKGMSDRFIRILSESILSVESAGNLIVIKTITASANAGCEAIDSMKWPEVLGTIAGDNTILVVVRCDQEAQEVAARFREMARAR